RVKIAGGLADDGVRQHLGELAGELPGIEERHPVDVPEQLLERIRLESVDSRGPGGRRRECRPLDPATVGASLRQTDLRQLQLLAGMLFAPARVIFADLRQE